MNIITSCVKSSYFCTYGKFCTQKCTLRNFWIVLKLHLIFFKKKTMATLLIWKNRSVLGGNWSFKVLGLYFSSKLDRGSYIISIAKLGPWLIWWSLFLLNLLYKFCMEYCCHVWAGVPSYYLDILDKLQKQVCRTVVPRLIASLETLTHGWNIASLSLQCSSELAGLVSLPYFSVRSLFF